MLLTTSKYNTPYNEKLITFRDTDGKRRALLYAFNLNKAVRAGTDPTAILDRFANHKELRGAYAVTDTALAALPETLRESIERKRAEARAAVARLQQEIDAYDLRDRLLMMPVDEAIKERIDIDGKQVNAVDHLAETLPRYHANRISDGYTTHQLFEIQKTIDL